MIVLAIASRLSAKIQQRNPVTPATYNTPNYVSSLVPMYLHELLVQALIYSSNAAKHSLRNHETMEEIVVAMPEASGYFRVYI